MTCRHGKLDGCAVCEEIEQLHVQLAGCGVAAMSNTRESLACAKEVKPGTYGFSASYSDVLRCVEREIQEREAKERAEELAERRMKLVSPDQDELDGYRMFCKIPKHIHDELKAERDALQRFKSFVHSYLDSRGVPVDPPGKHADEGCRVGQRLEVLCNERDARWRRMRGGCWRRSSRAMTIVWLPFGMPSTPPCPARRSHEPRHVPTHDPAADCCS